MSGADHSAEPGSQASGSSRRQFLRRAGLGGAGVAGGVWAASSGTHPEPAHLDASYGFAPLRPRHEPGFDHVVVLMFENRSFDHVLGRLYADVSPRAGQRFEGLQSGRHVNRAPDGREVAAHVYEGSTDKIMAQPDPDPGEYYPHVNTQLFDIIDPAGNVDEELGLRAPWNAPDSPRRPTMAGFVRDYVVAYRAQRGREPSPEEYKVVMGGFTPEMLPVFSTLARSFAVYDHWFCAVPSQTFPNRSFFHASTSHGFVTNSWGSGPGKWLDAPAVPTLFNRLQDAGKSWRVYYDAEQVISLTGFLHAPSIQKYWKTNFRSMEQYERDCASGNLPDYAFVEPRLIFDHNDMHPPQNDRTTGQLESTASDVRAAEALLARVYRAVRAGRSRTGSNAVNTALVVTFDEHGGLYDHVPPPSAAPPSGIREHGEMGFGFDRLGARVPAIVVSAYTENGSVINDEMHHGALIKTMCEQHGLAPLTRRDAKARSIHNVVNRSTPRQPHLWPDVVPAYVPPNPESTHRPVSDRDRHRPLTAPAKGLLSLLLARYEPDAPVPETVGDAYDVLDKHGYGLFGVLD